MILFSLSFTKQVSLLVRFIFALFVLLESFFIICRQCVTKILRLLILKNYKYDK